MLKIQRTKRNHVFAKELEVKLYIFQIFLSQTKFVFFYEDLLNVSLAPYTTSAPSSKIFFSSCVPYAATTVRSYFQKQKSKM